MGTNGAAASDENPYVAEEVIASDTGRGSREVN